MEPNKITFRTHRKTSFVNKSRAPVPGLHMLPENDFDLSCVRASGCERRPQNLVDGNGDLGTEWAHVVHCCIALSWGMSRQGLLLLTEDVESVRSIGGSGDDERPESRLQSHR